MTVFNMIVTYIGMIKSQLVNLMNESFNLFETMTEGIIVLSEDCLDLHFASKPAKEVLKQSSFPAKNQNSNNITIELKDIHKSIFKPTEISLIGRKKKENG